MRRRIIGLTGIVMLLVAVAVIPVASQPPVCTWTGSVTLDGSPAPGGTNITARLMDGIVVWTTKTLGSQYMVLVPREDGKPVEGETVYFYVVAGGNEYFGGRSTWNNQAIKTLNLVATTSAACEDNSAVAAGFASILPDLVIAYGYKASEGVGGWTVFNPAWASAHPEWNTLTTLYKGRGYWINVSEACKLTYSTRNAPGSSLEAYNLDEGWNLIGWMGC